MSHWTEAIDSFCECLYTTLSLSLPSTATATLCVFLMMLQAQSRCYLYEYIFYTLWLQVNIYEAQTKCSF